MNALQYCHRKGVVHGNLSLDTVMVTHQGHVAKLVAFVCEGKPQDDIRALGDIIDALQLPGFKPLVERCRGEFSNMDEALQAIHRPKSLKWLRAGLFLVALLVIVAGAFWTGHYMSQTRDKEQADSLPLPGIYFSDTIRLTNLASIEYFYSTVTGANIYWHGWSNDIPDQVSEEVAIDMGLSVRWAPFNLGSDNADVNHIGCFCLWCDTVGRGPFAPFDTYWPAGKAMAEIAGTPLGIVRRVWGGGWRMPTIDELTELRDKCVWTLVRQRGIPLGYHVKGPNGASIYMPLAGYRLRYREHELGTVGHYWSSTPVPGVDRAAYALKLDSVLLNAKDTVSLEYSLCIRPVLDN